ncbi:MAG TPA: hypothetical protein VGD68_06805 [Streptosporangiaceae bacterium]
MSDMDIEKPADDALEQEREVVEAGDTGVPPQRDELPFDANEADAAEQGRIVDDGEDDYR